MSDGRGDFAFKSERASTGMCDGCGDFAFKFKRP